MPARDAAAGRPFGTTRPSTEMVPACAGSRPESVDSSVVFPAPLGPTRATTLPASALRSNLDTMVTSP